MRIVAARAARYGIIAVRCRCWRDDGRVLSRAAAQRAPLSALLIKKASWCRRRRQKNCRWLATRQRYRRITELHIVVIIGECLTECHGFFYLLASSARNDRLNG